jgi:hypothetical protein
LKSGEPKNLQHPSLLSENQSLINTEEKIIESTKNFDNDGAMKISQDYMDTSSEG